MATKPTKPADCKEVTYTNTRWQLLKELRNKATEVMTALESFHLNSVVHGSVARGDVKAGSDIDVFISAILHHCGRKVAPAPGPAPKPGPIHDTH